MRGFCFFILLFLTGATATFPQITTSQAERVWFWSEDCQSGEIMGLEVVVDGRTVYQSSFRTCQMERPNATTEKQHDKKAFRFSGGHTFQNTHPTTTAESVEGNIWQAGAETDGILLGISFVAHDQVLLNTIHLVKPGKSTQSMLDRGVVMKTYPTAVETVGDDCSFPQDFHVIRVDKPGKRLFIESTASDVASRNNMTSYLTRLNRAIEQCQPSWKESWSASFFSDPTLAGYKTESALSSAVKSGKWSKAYMAEFDRDTEMLIILPLDASKRRTIQVNLSSAKAKP